MHLTCVAGELWESSILLATLRTGLALDEALIGVRSYLPSTPKMKGGGDLAICWSAQPLEIWPLQAELRTNTQCHEPHCPALRALMTQDLKVQGLCQL